MKSEHWNDEKGNPAGGISQDTGFVISWQNGPLGRGEDRKEPNGAFVENVLEAALDRLEFYEASRFSCEENRQAIYHLELAREFLWKRTKTREERGVEGTHHA